MGNASLAMVFEGLCSLQCAAARVTPRLLAKERGGGSFPLAPFPLFACGPLAKSCAEGIQCGIL